MIGIVASLPSRHFSSLLVCKYPLTLVLVLPGDDRHKLFEIWNLHPIKKIYKKTIFYMCLKYNISIIFPNLKGKTFVYNTRLYVNNWNLEQLTTEPLHATKFRSCIYLDLCNLENMTLHY